MLARVFQLIQEGWPPKTTEECIKPYFERRHELTVEQGCVMWGVRVVIPMKLQERVLDELHGGHIGVVKMKALAQSHVWWPGIDKEVELAASKCEGCRINKQSPKLSLPTASMGIPRGAMETHTPGFCRAYRRETVDGHGRRIFQMATSGNYGRNHNRSHSERNCKHICKMGNPLTGGHRQWPTIYLTAI